MITLDELKQQMNVLIGQYNDGLIDEQAYCNGMRAIVWGNDMDKLMDAAMPLQYCNEDNEYPVS